MRDNEKKVFVERPSEKKHSLARRCAIHSNHVKRCNLNFGPWIVSGASIGMTRDGIACHKKLKKLATSLSHVVMRDDHSRIVRERAAL